VSAYLIVFLSSDLLRGSLPGRSAFLDSIQSALACSVLLLPLGLPAAAAFLKGRTGREGFSRLEAFQFACCAGMSLAAAGSVLAGWLPPLSTGQLVWANAVGTALPSLALARLPEHSGSAAPTAGERTPRIVPDILVPGFLLAVLLLAVYRLGLGYSGDAPRAADRARSLVFLALCLVQAGEPLAGLGTSPGSGNPRTRARELGTTLVGAFGSLAPIAAAFLVPAARTILGLSVPEPAAASVALAGSGTYLVLRYAAGKVRTFILRQD
jgi:magnesium-transporting ATPase (P-type)